MPAKSTSKRVLEWNNVYAVPLQAKMVKQRHQDILDMGENPYNYRSTIVTMRPVIDLGDIKVTPSSMMSMAIKLMALLWAERKPNGMGFG